MSVLLLASSLVTTILIPADALQMGGPADDHAVGVPGSRTARNRLRCTYDDISTIFILWFAGASALAGLLNLVPRCLPRYGMAPEWARRNRPLVIIITVIGVVITIAFRPMSMPKVVPMRLAFWSS